MNFESRDGIEKEPTFAESFRREFLPHPLGKTTIALLLLQLGALVWHGADKVKEYKAIAEEERRIAADIETSERVQQKDVELRRIFGDHAPGFSNLGSLRARKDSIDSARAEFSVFDQVKFHPHPTRSKAGEGEVTMEQEPSDLRISEFHFLDLDDARFEAIEGSRLMDIVDRTFPKNWVRGEIRSITQSDQNRPMASRYGIKGVEAAHAGKGEVVFGAVSRHYLAETIFEDVLPHELGHENDWISDKDMSAEERADLLLKVTARLSAADRYHSDYVEEINNPEDPQRELYDKAKEYWAEIVSQYFRDYNVLSVEDFALVDAVVMKNDPGFRVDKAKQDRQSMLDTIRRQGKIAQL